MNDQSSDTELERGHKNLGVKLNLREKYWFRSATFHKISNRLQDPGRDMTQVIMN